MEVLKAYLPNFFEIFQYAYLFVFVYYGWIIFLLGMIYILWRLYRTEIFVQYLRSQKWVYVQIRVPKDNRVSTMGVDNIFSQLHSLHVGKTFFEKYVEGQIAQLWYSFELVSLGGKVSFIVRMPEKMRHNLESAVYSQYPTAEITEVEDYLKNFKYDPQKPGDYELWGTEWKIDQDSAIPIKTYKDFEHPSAEEKILDPLSHIFESLAKIEPHEFFGIQIIAMPLSDEEWKQKSEHKIKELTGEEAHHEAKFSDLLLAPLHWFANFSYKKALLPSHEHHAPENSTPPRNNWLNMTEGEKQRVTLIEAKANKPGYLVKIRFLYLAPKSNFDKSKVSMVVGAYRPFTAPFYNKIKPDMHTTWTTAHAFFSPTLEKPFLDYKLRHKKRWIFKGYKSRDFDVGAPMFILNTEEMATLYHFPITTETTSVISAIEKTDSKKSQAPADLPISEF